MNSGPSHIFYPSSNVRIAYLLIFILSTLIVLSLLWARLAIDSGGDFDLDAIGIGLLFTSPIWLMIYIPAFVWLFRFKYIKSIEFDDESQHIIISNNKGSIQKWPYRDLVFSISSSDFHFKLIFYRRVRARRGHYLNKKVNKLLAFTIPLGWSIKDLTALELFMDMRNIPSVSVESSGIMDDMFE